MTGQCVRRLFLNRPIKPRVRQRSDRHCLALRSIQAVRHRIRQKSGLHAASLCDARCRSYHARERAGERMAAQQIYHRAGGLVLLLADVFLRPTQKPGEDIDPQLPTRPAVKLFMGWPRLERVAQLLALLAFAWLLLLHLLMVVTEAPMEMRDGAMLATTAALLDGRNPYAIDGLM